MPVKTPRSAGGWGAILFSMKWAVRSGGLWSMLRALTTKNSCKSCALGMGGQQGGMRNEKNSFPEVCNKSILAQAADMQDALPADFFNTHDISALSQWSPLELELSGRLTQPSCANRVTHITALFRGTKQSIESSAKLKPHRPNVHFFIPAAVPPRFHVCPLPDASRTANAGNKFKLMTVRSEGQFNTVVYELQDRYRGVPSRDVVLMNPDDIRSRGFCEGQKVTVKSETGELAGIKIHPFNIRSGNILMYYPEANILVPRNHDKKSKTPSFKSVCVEIMGEG